MAQTGYTPIQLYYSSTSTNVPSAGNLVAGELAINTADGKLFYKDSGGNVQTIATKAGANGDVVGPASATDSALVAFDGTTGKLIKQAATVSVPQGGTGATNLNGILKGNGTSAFTVAVSGTDYAPATTGTSSQLLGSNGSGGFSNVTVGSGLTYSAGTLSASSSGITAGKSIAFALIFGF